MRKLSAVFCIFLCLVGLSVSAFAVVDAPSTAYTNLEWLEEVEPGSWEINFEFTDEALADSEKMEDYVNVMSDCNNPDNIFLVDLSNKNQIQFYSFDRDSFHYKAGSGVYANFNFYSADTISYVTLNRYSSGVDSGKFFVSASGYEGRLTLDGEKGEYISFNNSVWSNASTLMAPNQKFMSDIDTLKINDNYGEEEPDPPSSSEPDPPSIPETSFPEVGLIENEYVPYDTRYWNEFSDLVLAYIGSSTNVGFLCLAIILGLWLIIRIVKHFTKG